MNGNGNGNGNGYGDGYGNGYGNGNGNGNGYGYGYGLKIHSFENQPVYYIDEIPCTFISVKGSVAKVSVINTSSFQKEPSYIYKFNGVFAHGDTVRKAKEDAERKYYNSLGVEQSIDLFTDKFKSGHSYPNRDFYNWHTILTGSCDSGKDMWIRDKKINLESTMTPNEFIELTKNAYGGDIIQRLTGHYN